MKMARLFFFLTRNLEPAAWNLQRSRVTGYWSVVRCPLSVLLLCHSAAWGSSIYEYVSSAGVKILTNVGSQRISREETRPSRTLEDTHSNYSELISNFAGQHGLDEDLVKAIIRVESNYDADAVSPKGCVGLMQLHPDTARRFGVEDPFDPSQNIRGGTQYLNFLMNYFENDLELVLAAYNAGENAVIRHQGVPPYRETREYVKKVTSLYHHTAPASSPRRRHRVYRVVRPDGRVLFTNHPNTPKQILNSNF